MNCPFKKQNCFPSCDKRCLGDPIPHKTRDEVKEVFFRKRTKRGMSAYSSHFKGDSSTGDAMGRLSVIQARQEAITGTAAQEGERATMYREAEPKGGNVAGDMMRPCPERPYDSRHMAGAENKSTILGELCDSPERRTQYSIILSPAEMEILSRLEEIGEDVEIARGL